MILTQNGAAGYLNTMGGVIMSTLSLNITYREYHDNSCVVIFLISYRLFKISMSPSSTLTIILHISFIVLSIMLFSFLNKVSCTVVCQVSIFNLKQTLLFMQCKSILCYIAFFYCIVLCDKIDKTIITIKFILSR